MTRYVSRTCTEVSEKDVRGEPENRSRSLEDFRETDAYVLLGEPGTGKTVAFEREAARCPDGHYVTARDLDTFDARPEWHDATLFIDGLDEMRAGSTDGHTPLNRIRNKLNSLGFPRFRVSCREADWFGANDRTHLEKVSRNGQVSVLHLAPLSEDNIREILCRSSRIDDAESFIASAREKGIDGLLPNPQSLLMLAEAVAGGRWPETRSETFDLACRTLLREHNAEHQTAKPVGADISRLMEVAGRLCAVQLLSGNGGYTLLGNAISDPGYPGLEHIPGDDREILRYALGTKLFEGPSEGRVAPVHRQIAEFLAARYLASLIAKGLPVRRILSLMTGHDGVPVSELRGLFAWLATQSKTSRPEIITPDPLGTILYGDVREFSTDDKSRLLECLEREAKQKPWFWGLFGMDTRLGDIATPDMGDTIREKLRDPARDGPKQSFVRILLFSLKHGRVSPGFFDSIMEIVRDENWATAVRRAAIDAFIQQMGDSESAVGTLKSLLADIDAGSVSDPNDELLGSLLKGLYPERLAVTEILQYLRTPQHTSLFGSYYSFWAGQVLKKSTDAQCGELLDGIAEQFSRLKPSFLDSFGRVVYGRRLLLSLLRRLLESSQENVSPDRLFNWLGVVSDRALRIPLEEVEFIRSWLGARPELLKDLVKLGVRHCPKYELERRLFHLTRLAPIRESTAQEKHFREPHDEDRTQRQQEWYDRLKTHETALRENRCPPVLLHHLAEAYFGHYVDAEGDTPPGRLRSLLGNDETLIQAVLVGLRGSINRSDLPSDADVIRLGTRNRAHYLTLPFMAGLEEAVRIAPNREIWRDEKQMRLALAMHYTVPSPFDDEQTPIWFPPLLTSHPDVVAKVLIRSVRSEIDNDPNFARNLHDLAYSADHADMARLASLPLLETFPVRCTKQQLPGLHCLLEAALQHCKRASFLELIERKLAYRSMNVGQRIYWLVAGLRTSPDVYLDQLESCVAGNEHRIRYLAEAVAGDRRPPAPIERLNGQALKLLIQLLGRSYRPYFAYSHAHSEAAYVYTTDMQVSSHLYGAIGRLAADPSRSAADILESLATDVHLIPWQPDLNHAVHRQNELRRESCFRHGDIRQVIQVLDNRRPANAADLAALTTEYLRDISRNIRDGNTSDWKQYWNVDRYNRAERPKPEDACRDAILSDLKDRLKPLNIDAQPEGRYADDKRSDIRVSFGKFNVPVEIKKSCHRDLWSAIRRQLIAKYTRDPGAHGYGIYLVFWFGNTEHCRPTPGDKPPPKSAAQLDERLRDTLSEEEKRKISICVIDVAKSDIQRGKIRRDLQTDR